MERCQKYLNFNFLHANCEINPFSNQFIVAEDVTHALLINLKENNLRNKKFKLFAIE